MPVVAAAAVVALAQMYQSEKARKANSNRLAGIKRAFDALVPPKYNLSPMDPPEYLRTAIPEDAFDFSSMTPEDFELVGKFAPELAPFVAEQNPKLIEQTAASREGRQAQIDALRKLKANAVNGKDPELLASLDKAAERSRIESNAQRASVLQDAQRRGTFGSGTALAAELDAGEDAFEESARASRDASVAAYRNKMAAVRESAALGGDIHDSEMDTESANTSILNNFNERTTRARQDWENRRADDTNRAKVRNLDEEQRINDANVRQRNDFAVQERDRRDRMARDQYERRWNERNYQNDLRGRMVDHYKGERDRADNLSDRMYQYDFDKLAAANGVAYRQNESDMQGARDRNAAIQGVGNAAVSGYMYYDSNRRNDEAQDRADRRARYERTGSWDE